MKMEREAILRLTQLEYHALRGLVLEHFRECHKPGSTLTHEWVDLVSDEMVTVDDLLSLLLTYPCGVSPENRVKQNNLT